jgi:membrane protease subunit (stomatin/prohibitin family)
MGLIKALTSSASSALGDQFKEFVTCPEVANNVIVQRGEIHHGKGNPGASEGVISNGSAIVIPEGMAMMIVDNGKVQEFSAEAGTFTWDTSSEPSIFTGGLGKGILDTFKTIGSRFTFGGQTAKDQRVYYINIKTIPGMPFGSQQPETIMDSVYGSVQITYNGNFDIKVDDPLVLVNNFVGANAKDTLTFDDIFSSDSGNQLKFDFAQNVSAGISDVMTEEGISFREIQGSKGKMAIVKKMQDLLDESWRSQYGIIVGNVTLRINATEESAKKISDADMEISTRKRMANEMSEVYANNPNAKDTELVDVLRTAAGNENGAMMGIMGATLGQNATNIVGGVTGGPTQTAGNAQGVTGYCPNCGAPATGNFCSKCGTKLQ